MSNQVDQSQEDQNSNNAAQNPCVPRTESQVTSELNAAPQEQGSVAMLIARELDRQALLADSAGDRPLTDEGLQPCVDAVSRVLDAYFMPPLTEERIAELRDMFIRPAHECTEQFQEARLMAGTVDAVAWCTRCKEHSVINNVCLTCGNDKRARYGDFEREMTSEEWKQIQPNLPLPAFVRHTAQSSETQRAYWRQKQTEARQRKANDAARLSGDSERK